MTGWFGMLFWVNAGSRWESSMAVENPPIIYSFSHWSRLGRSFIIILRGCPIPTFDYKRVHMGVSIVMGEPQNGWFKVYSQFECIMENPMKWMNYDDLWWFGGAPISGNRHILARWSTWVRFQTFLRVYRGWQLHSPHHWQGRRDHSRLEGEVWCVLGRNCLIGCGPETTFVFRFTLE